MSTNAGAIIYDEETEPICAIYKHWDGYPDGFGEDLRSFCEPIKVVNGISVTETEKIANGMGCLAAQIVAHFKDQPGDVYMTTLDDGEAHEYTYRVRCTSSGRVFVMCDQDPKWSDSPHQIDHGEQA